MELRLIYTSVQNVTNTTSAEPFDVAIAQDVSFAPLTGEVIWLIVTHGIIDVSPEETRSQFQRTFVRVIVKF